MAGDAFKAGVADRRVGEEGLLRHCPHQTCELRHLSRHQLAAKIQISHDPIQRIAVPVIWCGREERAGDLRPMPRGLNRHILRSEEHTSELQSLMRISYAVFCLKKKKNK